jgi:hypothetical protein
VLLPHGDVLWLELKRPDGKGKVRDAQRQWHADALRLGHAVHVIESAHDAVGLALGDAR